MEHIHHNSVIIIKWSHSRLFMPTTGTVKWRFSAGLPSHFLFSWHIQLDLNWASAWKDHRCIPQVHSCSAYFGTVLRQVVKMVPFSEWKLLYQHRYRSAGILLSMSDRQAANRILLKHLLDIRTESSPIYFPLFFIFVLHLSSQMLEAV